MTLFDIVIIILIVQIIHFLGTWKLYQRAGRSAWQAIIPIYNAYVLMKIINRPWWWIFLLFIPIVQLLMFPVVWIETAKSFNHDDPKDSVLAVVTLGFYLYYINYFSNREYAGNRELKAKTKAGETLGSIIFAVVAATIVHTYFIQPFTIPTSSLEKSLLIGDFLFVSKFHYGARTPGTAVALPMVHDTIPGVKVKSYTNKPQLPMFRLPGFENVSRNDIVVFNWPVDTVPYFGYNGPQSYKKPIDKKSNYVKRAVGVSGDSLEIINGKVYTNGQPLQLPERADLQYSYIIKGDNFNLITLQNRYSITDGFGFVNREQGIFKAIAVPDSKIERFKKLPNVQSAVKDILSKTDTKPSKKVFPNQAKRDWNRDNFGPIYIPEAGKTVEIDKNSIDFYRRIIEVYEGREMGVKQEISIKDNQVLLNDDPISSYTFKQNYYWMMGDNRHNSEDSRFWGYVPQNHVVGKPVFIWLSLDPNQSFPNNIRWDRMFTTVSGNGERVSYLPYFLIGLVLIVGFRYFRKKRQS
ncbi:signal peptidase I [Mesohalobacter halotolerans]|uniref:Signal peptidase I n=1 Tax=Mesohalobacter halotolerans TaxID=1883405 RepID=A0A4U5TSP1_9FLAO|nr:signal peptidase I [Mesohalobacter halotolerans]TKS56368.1 signal peptidase I [Mesohalobacter halotolerans]